MKPKHQSIETNFPGWKYVFWPSLKSQSERNYTSQSFDSSTCLPGKVFNEQVYFNLLTKQQKQNNCHQQSYLAPFDRDCNLCCKNFERTWELNCTSIHCIVNNTLRQKQTGRILESNLLYFYITKDTLEPSEQLHFCLGFSARNHYPETWSYCELSLPKLINSSTEKTYWVSGNSGGNFSLQTY